MFVWPRLPEPGNVILVFGGVFYCPAQEGPPYVWPNDCADYGIRNHLMVPIDNDECVIQWIIMTSHWLRTCHGCFYQHNNNAENTIAMLMPGGVVDMSHSWVKLTLVQNQRVPPSKVLLIGKNDPWHRSCSANANVQFRSAPKTA